MADYKFTDKRIACVILSFVFFGMNIFMKTIGSTLLVRVFPRNLLEEFFDPIFYGMCFIVVIVLFWKVFIASINDFIKDYEKYINTSAVFCVITIILMVVSAILLDSFGVGNSSNQQGLDEAVAQYGAIHIITICLIGPVVEEILYRGILFDALKG